MIRTMSQSNSKRRFAFSTIFQTRTDPAQFNVNVIIDVRSQFKNQKTIPECTKVQ